MTMNAPPEKLRKQIRNVITETRDETYDNVVDKIRELDFVENVYVCDDTDKVTRVLVKFVSYNTLSSYSR